MIESMIKISANRVSVGKLYHTSPQLIWDLITDNHPMAAMGADG